MNIHPIFVHFPIGLLVAYSILELVAYAVPAPRKSSWLFSVRAFLLFSGVVTAFLALFTGGIAEDLVEATSPYAYVIELHSTFAGATTIIYLFLSLAYFVRTFDQKEWCSRMVMMQGFLGWWWRMKIGAANLILDTWLLPTLALVGLLSITITGGLGAVIVYGPNIDPFVSFIYHLFFAR
jgi:uncharacterized membrane protein